VDNMVAELARSSAPSFVIDSFLRPFADLLIADHQPLPPSLSEYVKLPRIEPARKSRGPNVRHRQWRDLSIVECVESVAREFDLKPTRNAAARDKSGAPQSACSIVAWALDMLKVNMTEVAVEKIWGSRDKIVEKIWGDRGQAVGNIGPN
jgi:hypothetical protein